MVGRPGLFSLIGVGRRRRPQRHLRPSWSRAIAWPTRCRTSSRRWRPASRLDAKLTGANPIDVLIEFPKGDVALLAGNARDDRRRARHRREARPASATSGRSRRCAAGLPRRPGSDRRRDAEGIRRHASRASRRGASSPRSRMPWWSRAAFPTSTPASSCRWSTSSTRRSTPSAQTHPGYEIVGDRPCRRSPRATAPA